MLLLKDNNLSEIEDSRVDTVLEMSSVGEECSTYEIYVDGELYTSGFRVYLEHNQYLAFLSLYKANSNMAVVGFGHDAAIIDMGVPNEKVNWNDDMILTSLKFTDYTEKVKEGISYFSDIIIEDEKNGAFKKNYIKAGVQL